MMKTYVITATALFLSACGFTPMHAPQGDDGNPALKNIQVDLVHPSTGAREAGAFHLQQALLDRIGSASSSGSHRLTITPKFTRAGFGVSAQDVATRYDVSVDMPYKLTDVKTGDVLDKGNVSAITTFGAPIDPYGREAAEQSATQNIAREAADRLLIRLAAYYAKAEKTASEK